MKNVIVTSVIGLILVSAAIYAYFAWQAPIVEQPRFAPPLNAETEVEGMLDPEKQKVIWDAEHVTFEIEHRLGKSFLKAWEARDTDKLRSLLHPEFSAAVPTSEDWAPVAKHPLTEQRRLTDAESEKVTSDPAEFLAFVMDPIKDLEIDKKKLRVTKIKDIGDQRWACSFLLVGSGKAGDIDRSFTSEQEVIVEVVDKKALADAASIVEWKIRKEVIRECSAPMMAEVTEQLGLHKFDVADNWLRDKLEANQHNAQIALEDFDGDNDLDLSVMTLQGKRFVLRFNGTTYEDATEELGLDSNAIRPDSPYAVDGMISRFSTAWVDIDNDGFPELISGEQIFRNEGGTKFTDITKASKLRFLHEPMGITVVDYNNDGFLDLYMLYQRPMGSDEAIQEKWIDESDSGGINYLYKNNGDGTFTDVTLQTKSDGGFRHSHAAVWFYSNDDPYPDVYIANDFGRNVLLESRNGEYFEDVSANSGADGFATSMGVVAGDIDNDGQTDLYVANMFSKMGRRIIQMVSDEDYAPEVYQQIIGSCAGNQLYCRIDGKYQDCGEMAGVNEVGWAWAPTMLDLDSDGLLDLYSTSGFMSFDHEKPDG